jgi:hypothetical protein
MLPRVNLTPTSNCDDVQIWFLQNGLRKYKELFRNMDGKTFLALTKEDIRLRLGAQKQGVNLIIDTLHDPRLRTPQLMRMAKTFLRDENGILLFEADGKTPLKRTGVALTRKRTPYSA